MLFLQALTIGGVMLLHSPLVWCQISPGIVSSSVAPDSAPDLKALAESLRSLQGQVQSLNAQVGELRAAEEQERMEVRELRTELRTEPRTEIRAELSHSTTNQIAKPNDSVDVYSSTASLAKTPARESSTVLASADPHAPLEERVAKLEDNQQLTDAKVLEQSQTKVESGSKYRLRLTGLFLLNAFETRGAVDNLDFPQFATPTQIPGTSGSFAGSLRQSQIGIEGFGPDIAGAHTGASLNFDFAGGSADTSNGAVMGIVRLRTGTVRLDWADTSIVAGQDSLFFAPLSPTSLASLAVPALSYSGNLWVWTPQIRIEHRMALSDESGLLFQAGIMDSLTGDSPNPEYRVPSEGEQSGQPGYAARVAWNHHAFGKDVTVGVGGYYGRQNWGFGRSVDGWVGTTDVTVPMGRFFDFSGEFYRGRAVGGFGGGIGQSVLFSGVETNPSTTIRGLDSMGGWAQLKFKPKANFEVNVAFGQDNPFNSELRSYPATAYYYGPLLSRNLTPFVNFIYRVRSNVLFSVEYRRLQTYNLDSNSDTANQIGLSVGYIF